MENILKTAMNEFEDKYGQELHTVLVVGMHESKAAYFDTITNSDEMADVATILATSMHGEKLDHLIQALRIAREEIEGEEEQLIEIDRDELDAKD